MKKYSILLAGLFFAMNLQAQPASRQARYYEAYQRNDLEQLKSVIREMETEAPEATLAIEMGAVAKDLELTIHPHPTLSETIMEAAEMFYGGATHVFKPKKRK